MTCESVACPWCLIYLERPKAKIYVLPLIKGGDFTPHFNVIWFIFFAGKCYSPKTWVNSGNLKRKRVQPFVWTVSDISIYFIFSSPHPSVIAPRVKEREWAHTMEKRKSKYIALQFESWAWSAIYFGLFLSHRCKRKSWWIILGKTRTWYSREDYIRFISVGDNTRVCGYWSSYTTPSAKTENPINANWSHDKSSFGRFLSPLGLIQKILFIPAFVMIRRE